MVIGLDIEWSLSRYSDGVTRSMDKLEKEYGFGCKNCVDLRTVAAQYDKERPQAAFLGSVIIAKDLCYVHTVDKPKSAGFDDWGNRYLNENQVKHATMNVFAYHEIGDSLVNC